MNMNEEITTIINNVDVDKIFECINYTKENVDKIEQILGINNERILTFVNETNTTTIEINENVDKILECVDENNDNIKLIDTNIDTIDTKIDNIINNVNDINTNIDNIVYNVNNIDTKIHHIIDNNDNINKKFSICNNNFNNIKTITDDIKIKTKAKIDDITKHIHYTSDTITLLNDNIIDIKTIINKMHNNNEKTIQLNIFIISIILTLMICIYIKV